MARKFSGTAAMATLISLVKRELNKKADKERSVSSVNGGTGDVTVGGRNYALKSADVATQTYPKGDETIGTQPSCFRDCYRPEMCKSGDIITISYKIKTKDLNFTGSPVARFQGRGYPDGTSFASDDYAMSYNRSKVVDGSFFENLQPGSNEVWHHVSVALSEEQATQEFWRFAFAVSDYDNITSGSITISDLKLERGTVPTDWTPAPEDIINALDSHEKNEDNPHKVTASQVGAVPTARTVNSKALDKDIVLSASDVGARPSGWTPSAQDVGAVPTSRKVNSKALSADITLTAADVGAAAINHSHTASQVTGVSRIQTGSYTGTGTFGASSPCRLTLNFTPKFVLIYAASMGGLTGDVTDTLGRYSESSTIIAGFGATDAYRESHISGGTFVYHGHVIDHFTWGANSFTWYSTGPDGSTSNCDGTIQLNASGVKYYYIAIG